MFVTCFIPWLASRRLHQRERSGRAAGPTFKQSALGADSSFESPEHCLSVSFSLSVCSDTSSAGNSPRSSLERRRCFTPRRTSSESHTATLRPTHYIRTTRKRIREGTDRDGEVIGREHIQAGDLSIACMRALVASNGFILRWARIDCAISPYRRLAIFSTTAAPGLFPELGERATDSAAFAGQPTGANSQNNATSGLLFS
ncbi:hypothetical protein KC345_g128 [Hortaea werneckii]|nr:hypothetical protein KC345_g128 [Hortaea werneckii]